MSEARDDWRGVSEARDDWRGELRVKGQTLHVSITGSGPPVLVVNGLGGSLGMLSDLRDDLEGHRVIMFDAPGTGKSPAPWHIYGVDWARTGSPIAGWVRSG